MERCISLVLWCKKPLCHVLARATPTRQHLYCLLPSPNSLPHFETTHQIFQSCLQKHGGTPCGFFVEVFACSLPSLHMLEARALHTTMSFKIKCAEKVSKREPHVTARLPFGLRPGQGQGRKQKPETKRPASAQREGQQRKCAAHPDQAKARVQVQIQIVVQSQIRILAQAPA